MKAYARFYRILPRTQGPSRRTTAHSERAGIPIIQEAPTLPTPDWPGSSRKRKPSANQKQQKPPRWGRNKTSLQMSSIRPCIFARKGARGSYPWPPGDSRSPAQSASYYPELPERIRRMGIRGSQISWQQESAPGLKCQNAKGTRRGGGYFPVPNGRWIPYHTGRPQRGRNV